MKNGQDPLLTISSDGRVGENIENKIHSSSRSTAVAISGKMPGRKSPAKKTIIETISADKQG